MAAPESQATAFEIEVLEGPTKGTVDGLIALVGSALPFRGVGFPTKQRSKTTYYPGNPVGSQQVFGATKDNTTITGVWYDAALGDGGARKLVRQIEYVVEHGYSVEVRWGGGALGGDDDVGITRRGLIKSIDPKYDMPQIISWTIEFEWRGENLQTAPPTFKAGPSSISTKADEFRFLADSLTNAAGDVSSWQDTAYRYISSGANAVLYVNDKLDDALTAFSNAVTVLDTAVAVATSGAELPGGVLDRVRGACDRVVNSCMDIRACYDAFHGLWVAGAQALEPGAGLDAARFFEIQAKAAKLALCPGDDPLDQMDTLIQEYEVMGTTDLVAEQCAVQAATLAAHANPTIIAEERPPTGSDLRDLAVKHYGNADMWVLIADFNDLDSSEVPETPTGPSDLGAPPIFIPDQTAYAAMLARLWGAEQPGA